MSLRGMGSAVSLLCLSAASHKGHSFYCPLSPCVSALGTSDSQPSAGSSAPVDTRGENTKHLAPINVAESQGWSTSYTLGHYTRHCTFTHYKEMFPEALCIYTSKNILFIIKFYQTGKK